LCPHCLTKCSFAGDGNKDTIVLWCVGCHNGVYFRLRNYDIADEYKEIVRVQPEYVVDYYPRRVITMDPSIPKEIADDYDEANRCNDVLAHRATVAMCRRSLQSACISKGADPKVDLIDQIDELETKRVINPSMKEIAHAVRMVGNWGAHPQEDPLKKVTSDDAIEILKFTSEFLDETFIRPARLATLKAKKGLK